MSIIVDLSNTNYIKTLCSEKGVLINELSKATNISVDKLKKVEEGEYSVSFEEALAIAEYFSLHAEDIF